MTRSDLMLAVLVGAVSYAPSVSRRGARRLRHPTLLGGDAADDVRRVLCRERSRRADEPRAGRRLRVARPGAARLVAVERRRRAAGEDDERARSPTSCCGRSICTRSGIARTIAFRTATTCTLRSLPMIVVRGDRVAAGRPRRLGAAAAAQRRRRASASWCRWLATSRCLRRAITMLMHVASDLDAVGPRLQHGHDRRRNGFFRTDRAAAVVPRLVAAVLVLAAVPRPGRCAVSHLQRSHRSAVGRARDRCCNSLWAGVIVARRLRADGVRRNHASWCRAAEMRDALKLYVRMIGVSVRSADAVPRRRSC